MLRALMRASAAAAGRSLLWPALVATMVIAIAAGLRWYVSDSVIPWDSKNQFHAFLSFLAQSLHDGASPFWNPYHYGGHPSIADPQSLVFSPVFLAWAYLDRSPGLYVIDLMELLHLLAGGLALVWLGARRGWPSPASLLAAAVFMLGGAASARLNHTGIIIAYGLFPVAVALLEAALLRKSLVLAALTGFVAAVILTGRSQVSLLLILALGTWLLVLVASADRPVGYVRERLAVLAIAGGVTLVLSAIPVLLTLQLAQLSNRPAAALKEALESSLYPPSIVSMMAANVFGAHAPNWGYWGPNWARLPEVAATDETFTYMFVGAVPVLLIGWLGLAGRGLMQGGRWLMLGLAVTLLFALGRYTPLFGFAFEHLPGIAYFRRPVDGLFLFGIVLALASGHVLAGYVRRGLPTFDPLWSAVVLAGGVTAICGALAFSAQSGHGLEAATEVGKAAAIMAAAAAALTWGARNGRRELVAMLVVAIAVGELLWWNTASRLNAEPRRAYEMLETAEGEDARALAILQQELERRHGEGAHPRVEVVGLGGPWQNIAMVLKLEATTGYNPLRIGAYDRFVSPGERPYLVTDRRFPPTFEGYECALARSLGIEYVVLGRPIESLTQLRRRPAVETLLAGPSVWIYRLKAGMPRVRFTSDVFLADADAVTRSGEFTHVPSEDSVIIDDETPPKPMMQRVAHRTDMSGTVDIVGWSNGRVVVDVDAPDDGIVVLNDLFYPGWMAEVDGVPTPVLRADVLFRAVQVEAGRHRIEFRFEPLSLANLIAAARQVAGLN